MASPFLDSNVLLRHVIGDHPEHSPRATAYLQRVEAGELKVHITDTVVFEAVFTLQRYYQQPPARIRDAILPLIELPAVILPGKRRFRQAFDLYVDLNLPFADAYHVAVMQQLGLDQIVSLDRHFDRVAGLVRLEP